MDANEATTIVLSKIKNIDPDNATKIMGYLLIQDLDDKDLIRLAFGPETVLQSYILKAKANLGLSSGACPPPSTPPSPSPLLGSIARPGNPNNAGGHFLPLSSPRLAQRADFDMGKSPKNPFSRFPGNPMSPGSSPSLPFGGSQFFQGSTAGNTGDFLEEHQLGEYFPFLNDPGNSAAETHLHRRSFSESDACFMSEDGGFCSVHRPCLYFARGFCKNGNSCKFLHGGSVAEDFEGSVSAIVGSPSGLDAEHMLRLKIAHQRRVATAAAAPFMPATSPTSYNKYMNLFLQHHSDPQSQRLAAMMMGDDIYKYGRFQPDRNEFLAMGMAEKSNSASRQIYLTFPADSTFKDEDVSDYFSTYGPVQDVRIPYQQKRMFGFVTFHYPETVRTILAKGNPHFICNSRVLVKPYKEKGKVPEKRQLQQQQFERGEFSPSSNSSFLESGESYEHLGTRLFNSSHEMMLRRKFEQENDFQQAIELQGRRLMNLQLPEGKNDSIYHRMRSMPMGSTAPIPIAYSQNHHRVIHESEGPNQELVHGVSSYQIHEDSALSNSPFVVESCGSPATTISSITVDVNAACNHIHGGGDESKDESSNPEGDDKKESLENILPDSPFASPTKSAGDHCSEFAKLADISENAKVSGVYDNNGSATMTSVDSPPH